MTPISPLGGDVRRTRGASDSRWLARPPCRLSPQAPGIGVATLVVASLVVFAVLEVLPGDPARLMLGINATPDAVAALREQMGLDQPLICALPRTGSAAC